MHPRATRPPELKGKLFETAASRPEWMVAHCAAVLAVSPTCRGVEIKNLRWQDVDLFGKIATIRRSKTTAGHRTISLNSNPMASLACWKARGLSAAVSPSTKFSPPARSGFIDPSRPQKSWRTGWRKLVRETARRVGREAAQQALESGKGLRSAIAWKRAAAPIRDLRFHDLRHQAITEMAEAGASDATLMAVAGHMS
jgi:integrase